MACADGVPSPQTKCFESDEANRIFLANTILQNGVDLHPNIGSLAAREDLLRDFSQLRASQQVQGALCAKNMNPEILKYMGTTFVAKDIDFMTTVMEGKHALMY